MEKFTQYNNKENKKQVQSLFNSEDFKLVDYEGSKIMETKDEAIILPYLKDEGFILLQYEKNLNFSYKLKDTVEFKNIKDFLTIIKTSVEKSAISSIKSKLLDCGIVLNSMYPIEISKILFKNNLQTGQYYIALLELGYNDYKLTQGKDTGVFKVDLGYIDDIKSMDLITDYMIEKLRKIYKI